MFVKLNLLVICAVILNFGECSNCDDVLKCVSYWVATALSPNSNATAATVVDIANVSISNQSLNDNLFTDFTHYLEERFSSLIKESFFKTPSINVLENKFQINIQTYKINETKPEIVTKTATAKPDLAENNLHKVQNVELLLPNSAVEEETRANLNVTKTSEIDIIQTMTEATETKSEIFTKNKIDEYIFSLFSDEKFENKMNVTAEYKTTTSMYSNIDDNDVSKTIAVFAPATQYQSNAETTTLKNEVFESNGINTKLYTEANRDTKNTTNIEFDSDEKFENKMNATAEYKTTTSMYSNIDDNDVSKTIAVFAPATQYQSNAETTTLKNEVFESNGINTKLYTEANRDTKNTTNIEFDSDEKFENKMNATAEYKTTTSMYSNVDDNDVSKTAAVFAPATQYQSNAETTTLKNEVFESIGINTKLYTEANRDTQNTTNIKDNYIDDAYDFLNSNNEIYVENLAIDNLTDYLDIDYTDLYKDTTNEDVKYTPAVYIPTTTETVKILIEKKPVDAIDSVYPWIATVFLMNGDSKQFEYVCDGSLVSARVVLTAARCVIKAYATVDASNTLVILGKRSLQTTGSNEIVSRVNSIQIHDKHILSEKIVENDLAILVLTEPVSFNDNIKPALLGVDDNEIPIATATTGWHVSGPLQPLYLELKSPESCMKDTNSENIICATLGDSETTCPSYGGLLVQRQNDSTWHLKGISSGTPTNEGVCFNKHLKFTKLVNFLTWIMNIVHENSE